MELSVSSSHSVTPASTPKDPGNYRRDPPRTCRTTTYPLDHRRLALDRPFDPGIAESGDRANTDRFSPHCADLPSNVPTELDPSVLSDRGHRQSLGSEPD